MHLQARDHHVLPCKASIHFFCEQLIRQHPTHLQRCYGTIALCILPLGKPQVQEELPDRAKEPHAGLHHRCALMAAECGMRGYCRRPHPGPGFVLVFVLWSARQPLFSFAGDITLSSCDTATARLLQLSRTESHEFTSVEQNTAAFFCIRD